MPRAMIFAVALLAAVAAALPMSDAIAEDPHQAAFERITNAVFPPLAAVPIYRTIKTFVTAVDGVELYTVAFVPLGKKHFDTVMIRTPYGTDGDKCVGETYVEA